MSTVSTDLDVQEMDQGVLDQLMDRHGVAPEPEEAEAEEERVYEVVLEQLPAHQLRVDHTYQRDFRPKKAEKIINEFDRLLLGVLSVSAREGADNSFDYVVIDGQHRHAAVMDRDPDLMLDCLVYYGLDLDDEARIFWKSQATRTTIPAIDALRARVIAGDQTAIDIKDVLDDLGITAVPNGHVYNMNGRRWVRAVRALDDAYARLDGKDGLREVLNALMTAWPQEQDAFRHEHILGLTIFMQKFGDRANLGRLIARLSGYTPFQVRRMARSHMDMSKSLSKETAFARALTEIANQRVQERNRLSWS